MALKSITNKTAPQGKVVLPQKRTINLMQGRNTSINKPAAVIGTVLIIIVACLFSKFFVVNKLDEMNRSNAQLRSLQTRLDSVNEQLAEYESLSGEYAHYSFEGLTADELGSLNRVEVLEMIEKVVMPYATVETWSVSGNMLTIQITGATLNEVNQVVEKLEQQEIVNYCSVMTANGSNGTTVTKSNTTSGPEATIQVTAYLKSISTDGIMEGEQEK